MTQLLTDSQPFCFKNFLPPHILKNNFSQLHKTHFHFFCWHTRQPEKKWKSVFSQRFIKFQILYLHLTKFDKPNKIPLKHLGQKIRELREKQNLLLRQVAAHLEVDTALMSKIERGERNASKEQVQEIAKFLKADTDELLTLWLADKFESAVGDEKNLASDAMNIVKKKMKKWIRE